MPDGQIPFQSQDRTDEIDAPRQRELKITTVKTIEDMMRVTAIRAAVYMAEQDFPYEEEFDGNDFCATHLIGWVDGEPVGCLRIRYFGGFAKVERVAVRAQFRKTRIAFKMVRAAFDHCLRKGFTKVLGHARDELIPLYKMFGCRVAENGRSLVFSDYSYTEMIWEGDLPENAITLESDPYALIRPEGDWDRPGILEQSVDRNAGSYAVAAE